MSTTATRLAPVLTDDASDPINYLWSVVGDVLGVGDTGSGEYDSLRTMSTSTRRRLAGARLVATGGTRADVLLHDVQCGHSCPSELVNANADQFVTWYVETALQGLDYRASLRSGDSWCDYDDDARYLDHLEAEYGAPETTPAPVTGTVPKSGTVRPVWYSEWHARLLHAPKRELLEALAAHRWDGGPAPIVGAESWALDVVRKFERRCTK